MIQISENTKLIQPSKIRKMFNKALEYDQVLSFTLGEPDFTASENVGRHSCRRSSSVQSGVGQKIGC